MPIVAHHPLKNKTIDGISSKVAEAIKREYHEWTDSGEDATRLNQWDSDSLFDGTMPISKAYSLRRMLAAHLIGNGVRPEEIRRRLCIPRLVWVKLREQVVGPEITESEKRQLAGESKARTEERMASLRKQRLVLEKEVRDIELGGKKKSTSAERKVIADIIRHEDALEGSLRKLLGLDAPERIEVKQHKTYSVSFEINGTREQLADILDVTSQPALTDQRGN